MKYETQRNENENKKLQQIGCNQTRVRRSICTIVVFCFSSANGVYTQTIIIIYQSFNCLPLYKNIIV